MRFLDALAFLTRLVPARRIDARLVIASVPWFAPAGLMLGICCTGAAWLFHLLLAADMAKAQSRVWSCALAALIWLALEVWISRGLHWDGLADLADALGGRQSKEEFRKILKDSRLGTFGVLALFFVAAGQWLACCWHISLAHWMELSLAPAWGRAAAVCLAAAAPPHPESVLGSLAHAGTSRNLSRCHSLAALVVLWFLCLRGLPFNQAVFLAVLQCLLIHMLARLARQRGGISGDYLGSGIELSQLCFLTMTL